MMSKDNEPKFKEDKRGTLLDRSISLDSSNDRCP